MNQPISLKTLNRMLMATVVICVIGMTIGGVLTLSALPPLPERTETMSGALVFTSQDIVAGKKVFIKYNLMSYGSLLGNGAYYGPDYTAEYLDMVSSKVQEIGPNAVQEIRNAKIAEGVLRLPDWWVDVHTKAKSYYEDFYVNGNAAAGVGRGTIPTVEEAHQFTDFIAWSALISIIDNPKSDGSYTNNWPYEPKLGNVPTPRNLFWTMVTIAIVLFLTALIVMVYEYLRVESIPDLPLIGQPGTQEISPAQKAAIPLFAIATLLFLVQTFAGGYIANAFASRQDFYGVFQMLGLERAVVFPFAAIRAIHVDLGVLWVIGMWMAAALFLAPFLGGNARPWVKKGTHALTVIISISVLGGLLGIYLATRDMLGGSWFWLGTEGMEYVDMGRIWKLGITGAFVLWIVLMLGSYGSVMKQQSGHVQRVLVGIGIGISAAFLPSLFFLPDSHFVLADFWRWWTVHLWVEGILAFFQVAVLATVFFSLKLVDKETVTKSIYFEGFLVVVAGSFAIGHHYWWVGEPSFWISIGSIFSTLEVIPLFMLLFHALSSYRKFRCETGPSPHRLALLFLMASAVWQFIGSGILGLILNFPIINYYEHGTYLTVAHAHGSFLGGFGFLAIGLMLYSLRFTVSEAHWSERMLNWSFYLLNVGLLLMLVVSVVPVGLIQIFKAFSNTFHASRELAFYQQEIVQLLMKLRMPGDTLIILGAFLLTFQILRMTLKPQVR